MILVDDTTFENFKKASALLLFSAPWCAPCTALYPTIIKLSEEFPDINFLKINVDESPDLTSEFGVRTVPTLMFLRDGELVDSLIGVHSLEKLRYVIKENFNV